MNSSSPRIPRRSRTKSRGVAFGEWMARSLITAGGIGTIAAVILISVFLVWVVVPLFQGAQVESPTSLTLSQTRPAGSLLVDEDQLLVAEVDPGGSVGVYLAADGQLVERRSLTGDRQPATWRLTSVGGLCAFGFEDGSAIAGRLQFGTEFLDDETPGLEDLAQGQTRIHGGGVVVRTPIGQLRRTRLEVDLTAPLILSEGVPLVALDYKQTESTRAFAALDAAGRLALYKVRERTNLLTGEVIPTIAERTVPYEPAPERGTPAHLFLNDEADNLFLAWQDGRLERYDVRQGREPTLAEVLDVVEDEAATLSAAEFLIGGSTLLTGDSDGRVRAWFRIKTEETSTVDGSYLVPAHELAAGSAAVTALAPSSRTRTVLAGYGDGSLRLFHVTGRTTLAEIEAPGEAPIATAALAPREDGLVARCGDELALWSMNPRYPEASVPLLFGKVWYEDYPEPQHVWQSSSATDDHEPKLGLVPLIYGTIKATIYSMLFGAPLAILAAIYTSEFLHRRWRNPIKSTIEMMASLPSVVLGFLAAAVFAPAIEPVVPAVLAALLTVPLAFVLGAQGWQLLPPQRARRLSGVPRTAAMVLALPLGIGAALLAGPWIESLLFAGDIVAWLDGQVGSGLGGWMMLLIPFAALGAFLIFGRVVTPRLTAASRDWSDRRIALVDLGKLGAGLALALMLALAGAALLTGTGSDPRGSLLGTYVQRNALIVGFAMGFAVIPIIYTIAEDALSSVPEHLRLGSIGAGATPWQTAVRIIIPTAMSGLFSAVMIGLGRAVGETMIVLMATGNTAIMEANPFNGFRTLSANIAFELPEAVQRSAHYRTLFLAALTLFVMTFALNTLAETVRQRFRKKAFEL